MNRLLNGVQVLAISRRGKRNIKERIDVHNFEYIMVLNYVLLFPVIYFHLLFSKLFPE